MATAIFLGGGASAAEGAPMQSGLIREYFSLMNSRPNHEKSVMFKEIATYFKELFGLDTEKQCLEKMYFPTFEEALGILDLAVRRREALINFDLENISRNSNRIGFMRQYLVLLLAEVLDNAEKNACGLHRKLADNLNAKGLLGETFFITTNYDTLIDKALATIINNKLDYGFDFSDCSRAYCGGLADPIKLYKVHGSLNWLYCPACNTICLASHEPGVIRLVNNISNSECGQCGSIMLPVIVPPTFFKEMTNVYLNMVWNKAEQHLRQAEKIIFCGYSFPDSDIHIKYLLKRVQTNRKIADNLKIIVINNHCGKNAHKKEQEKNRYLRFLGYEVNYTDLSFAEFTAEPEKVYQL